MEGFCRACLNKFNEPSELLQYCESNRRLFVYCTGLQVKRNDTFTFQLCKECHYNLKNSCKFKKQCRISDKKFKDYLGLKKDGESIDFTTYLRNTDDTLTLRFPASNSNTPVHQKNYDDDDDNVSTCTSIQNFMSDILQDEEMLQTEAKLIREVIQEEADILDDSLDSHWLQDEMSVDNEFGMDFNFAGFSTPSRSVNNDHCYTPKRLANEKKDEPYYYSLKDTRQKSDEIYMAQNQKDMPLLDIGDNKHHFDFNDIVEPDEEIKTSIENDMLFDTSDIKLDDIVEDNIIMDDLENKYNGNTEKTIDRNGQITIILNKGVASEVTNSPLTNELEYYMNKVELNRMSSFNTSSNCKSLHNEKNINSVFNHNKVNATNQSMITQDVGQYREIAKLNSHHGKDIENIESPVKLELDEYINKAESSKINLNLALTQGKNRNHIEKCSIDRNLEMALKNDDSQEFSLDQLLISPQVSLRSGVSTPTINNILFGNITSSATDRNVTDSKGITIKKENIIPGEFIEEFLRDDSQIQSIPKEMPKEVSHSQQIRVKDLSKLKEMKVKTQRNIAKGDLKDQKDTKSKIKNRTRGCKDIRKLKDLLVFENNDYSETSDIEMSDNEETQQITDAIENKEGRNDSPKNNDELDISISNLLSCDDDQSVDLNISIASDFLKEDKLDKDNSEKCSNEPEDAFKVPFSPPDNKYDLNKGLCKICDRTFKSKRALKLHFVKTHKQQLPKAKRDKNIILKVCSQCGKGFRDHSCFNKHMKKHEDADIFKCDYCTLEFSTRGKFNQHQRTHADEIAKKENKTLDNNKEATGDSEKADEQCQEKAKTTKSYVCTTCGKVFKTVSNLYVHVRRHNKIYTHKCQICQKGFIRKYDLDMHTASHNKDYPFECQYCPKKYRSRYLLVGHMYRHLGKERFKCEVCDKHFVSNQYLKQHYKTDMCINNRKALDERRITADVTVVYKPYVHNSIKSPEESTVCTENESKDEFPDIKTELSHIDEELIKNEPSPSPKINENNS